MDQNGAYFQKTINLELYCSWFESALMENAYVHNRKSFQLQGTS